MEARMGTIMSLQGRKGLVVDIANDQSIAYLNPKAEPHVRPLAEKLGSPIIMCVRAIDNRRLARLAKLAGAPRAPGAGIDLHVRLGECVERNEPLFTLHAERSGELTYARLYMDSQPDIITVEEE
jgi:thymidine phosphorylase